MGFTKNIPAVILGALIALVLTFVLQGIVTNIYPLPPGTDMLMRNLLQKHSL